MSTKLLVVATPEELELPWAKAMMADKSREVVITGVGGTNVIRALRKYPDDTDIFNVGYCGSSFYRKGTVCWIGYCRLWHPVAGAFQEPSFKISEVSKDICLTAGDFVTSGDGLPAHSVVDMELAYIAALGFKSITSVKYVSDNCNFKDYKEALDHGI